MTPTNEPFSGLPRWHNVLSRNFLIVAFVRLQLTQLEQRREMEAKFEEEMRQHQEQQRKVMEMRCRGGRGCGRRIAGWGWSSVAVAVTALGRWLPSNCCQLLPNAVGYHRSAVGL